MVFWLLSIYRGRALLLTSSATKICEACRFHVLYPVLESSSCCCRSANFQVADSTISKYHRKIAADIPRQHIWLNIIPLAEKLIGHFFKVHGLSPSIGRLMSRYQIESFWKNESVLEVAAKSQYEDDSHVIFAVLFNWLTIGRRKNKSIVLRGVKHRHRGVFSFFGFVRENIRQFLKDPTSLCSEWYLKVLSLCSP